MFHNPIVPKLMHIFFGLVQYGSRQVNRLVQGNASSFHFDHYHIRGEYFAAKIMRARDPPTEKVCIFNQVYGLSISNVFSKLAKGTVKN